MDFFLTYLSPFWTIITINCKPAVSLTGRATKDIRRNQPRADEILIVDQHATQIIVQLFPSGKDRQNRPVGAKASNSRARRKTRTRTAARRPRARARTRWWPTAWRVNQAMRMAKTISLKLILGYQCRRSRSSSATILVSWIGSRWGESTSLPSLTTG